MMCFKDRTFCPGWVYERCKDAKACDRPLTKQVQDEAVKWWGSDDAPICIYRDEPGCFNSKEKEDE